MSILPQLTVKDCTANIQILPIEPAEERVVGLALPPALGHGAGGGADVPPHRGLLQGGRVNHKKRQPPGLGGCRFLRRGLLVLTGRGDGR